MTRVVACRFRCRRPFSDDFFYLVAVMDWASRHVLSWRLSNTMDSAFYNELRPHSALDGRTPGEVYRGMGVAA